MILKILQKTSHVYAFLHRHISEVGMMKMDFQKAKLKIKEVQTQERIDPDAIFCNNEVNLGQINCYGFDYDYTLCQYTQQLERYIFEQARDLLVHRWKYHEAVLQLDFDSKFAIRGLHYDVRNGLLLKVDAYNNIQSDAVYRGRSPVSRAEIVETYNGNYLPRSLLTKHRRGTVDSSDEAWAPMSQLLDSFVIPEMNLIGSISQLFRDNEIDFDPAYLYQDVSKAVGAIHKSGQLHEEIMMRPELYVQADPGLDSLLCKLCASNKRLFIITNSEFHFIDAGMRYITGNDRWRDYFQVIVTTAKKPQFFISRNKPFRRLVDGQPTWARVRDFEMSGTYREGNLHDFMLYTGWNPREICYFGDHIYADLADVASLHGWKTGCIVRELATEIAVLNSAVYRRVMLSLSLVEQLMTRYQHASSVEARLELQRWTRLRHKLRYRSKALFNPHFGSIFRTYHNPSLFSQRISQYADLYSDSVNNLAHYALDHRFYPRRKTLPHEPLHSPPQLD